MLDLQVNPSTTIQSTVSKCHSAKGFVMLLTSRIAASTSTKRLYAWPWKRIAALPCGNWRTRLLCILPRLVWWYIGDISLACKYAYREQEKVCETDGFNRSPSWFHIIANYEHLEIFALQTCDFIYYLEGRLIRAQHGLQAKSLVL